ncbi:MAG: M23 family metallopeptidase [Chloroflexi bacterium]|nr:M23 family metallopeptidase [Chloroflexota bacterium]
MLWVTGAGEYAVWWLTESKPPVVTLEAPPSTVRGTVGIAARLAPSGRVRLVDAQVDGRPLALAEPLLVDTSTLPDGQHQVSVTVEDLSLRHNRTTMTAALKSDNTPPQLSLDPEPQRVKQGHTWLLRIQTNEPASVEARLGDRPLDVQVGDGFGWAIIGIGPDAPLTTSNVVVDGTDPAGNHAERQEPVEVQSGDFDHDAVEVEASMLPLLSIGVRNEEDRYLLPTYQQFTPQKLWDGRFLQPLSGQIITEFGTMRSYNGGPIVGHHGGVDIAAPAGRPVVAPARGRVVKIDEVKLRGRVVVLDHGLGVFTVYGHLSAVDVQLGQVVERGQPFAKVGSTGLSTGPHLHWEMWVAGENVAAMEWTQRAFP